MPPSTPPAQRLKHDIQQHTIRPRRHPNLGVADLDLNRRVVHAIKTPPPRRPSDRGRSRQPPSSSPSTTIGTNSSCPASTSRSSLLSPLCSEPVLSSRKTIHLKNINCCYEAIMTTPEQTEQVGSVRRLRANPWMSIFAAGLWLRLRRACQPRLPPNGSMSVKRAPVLGRG